MMFSNLKKEKNSNKMVLSNAQSLPTRRVGKIEQILSILPIIGTSKPVVAVMKLEGVIGKVSSVKSGLTISSLNKNIEKMFKLDRLDAVCLCVNSPGGSPVQSELISKRISKLAKEKGIPIYSFVEDIAASGGYWLACTADKIYASESSILGSIGVISSSFGFHDAISKLGIERRVYTQGKTKSVLDPFQPAKDDDIKIIKKIQKKIHDHFINTIKTRRAGRLTQNDDILFNGEFWTGKTALDYGIIDGIDDLYSFIEKKYGDHVKIEYIENQQSWIKKKLGLAKVSREIGIGFSERTMDIFEEKSVESKFKLL